VNLWVLRGIRPYRNARVDARAPRLASTLCGKPRMLGVLLTTSLLAVIFLPFFPFLLDAGGELPADAKGGAPGRTVPLDVGERGATKGTT
jgi:hypothetical protein